MVGLNVSCGEWCCQQFFVELGIPRDCRFRDLFMLLFVLFVFVSLVCRARVGRVLMRMSLSAGFGHLLPCVSLVVRVFLHVSSILEWVRQSRWCMLV